MTSRAALVLVAALLVPACSRPARPESPRPPSLGAWRGALRDLAAERRRQLGDEPRTLKLSFALREPFTGRRTEARGAVALSPRDRAVRMILIGPGGTTALDLWIREDRFRLSIPAVDLLRRGDASTPREQMRGLPVDFLRWWLLDPTRGELLWTAHDGAGRRVVLRDGDAITKLVIGRRGGPVYARRQTWSRGGADSEAPRLLLDEEIVRAARLGCADASYTQASTGVEIEIKCEGVEPNPPSERAFEDPDAPAEEEEER